MAACRLSCAVLSALSIAANGQATVLASAHCKAASLAAAVRDAEEEGLGPQVQLLQMKALAMQPSSASGLAARADAAAAGAAGGFEEAAWQEHLTFRPEGTSGVYFIMRISLFIFSLFALGVFCECMAHWRHWARFRSCQAKIQRVHDSIVNPGNKTRVCPYCLDHLDGHSASSKVTFLCGHSFHFRCMNECYQASKKSGLCPICDVATAPDAPLTSTASTDSNSLGEGRRDGAQAVEGEQPTVGDQAQYFILRVLQRRYPDIVSEECVQRWASRHTEIWLSELQCPSYRSMLRLAK